MTSSLGTINSAPLGAPTSAQVGAAQSGAALAIQRSRAQGICSLTWNGHVFRFRTNPNAIEWTYTLNTKVDNTYGGRVIQILSCKIDDLVITVDCGWGGWQEAMRVCDFMANLMVSQRQGAGTQPATFEYTTRNWKMKVFAASVPFQDEVTATTRELELRFKVQEDVSGYMSQASIGAELSGLQEGIGGGHDQFNTGSGSPSAAGEQSSVSVASTLTGATSLLTTLGSVTSFMNLGGMQSNLLGGSTALTGLIPIVTGPFLTGGILGGGGSGGGSGGSFGGGIGIGSITGLLGGI
jgi:hypothetical protein